MNEEVILKEFNAKHQKTADLIKEFVPSEPFKASLVNGHSVILGPRGSGKTTILRMLANDALPYWNGENASLFRESFPYEGIYVGGDKVWAEIISSLSKLNISTNAAETLAISAFNTCIFVSATEAFINSYQLKSSSLGSDALKSLKISLIKSIKEIANILLIQMNGISLESLKFSLEKRQQEIGSLAYKLSHGYQMTENEIFDQYPYLTIKFKNTFDMMLGLFDSALDRPANHKWALLLDEFEIAPEALQNDVLSDLRSSSKKFIYKIALIPCRGYLKHVRSGSERNIKSSKNNDYNIIELWHKSKNEIQEFFSHFIKAKYKNTPLALFGETPFLENSTLEWGEKWGDVFEELGDKDATFREYMEKKGMDYKDVKNLKRKPDDWLRKVAPIVAYRNEFRNEQGNTRTRKSLETLYAGWQAIAAISEGNPRWLILTLNTLVNNPKELPISRAAQAQQVTESSKTYWAMLKTAALKDNLGISTSRSPSQLIQSIGECLKENVVNEAFNEDPYLSFEVDKNELPDVINALKIALNYGALISMTQGGDIEDYDDLKDKRFRVSYLLAPKLGLPLRASKARKLSTILGKDKTIKNTEQGKLF